MNDREAKAHATVVESIRNSYLQKELESIPVVPPDPSTLNKIPPQYQRCTRLVFEMANEQAIANLAALDASAVQCHAKRAFELEPAGIPAGVASERRDRLCMPFFLGAERVTGFLTWRFDSLGNRERRIRGLDIRTDDHPGGGVLRRIEWRQGYQGDRYSAHGRRDSHHSG